MVIPDAWLFGMLQEERRRRSPGDPLSAIVPNIGAPQAWQPQGPNQQEDYILRYINSVILKRGGKIKVRRRRGRRLLHFFQPTHVEQSMTRVFDDTQTRGWNITNNVEVYYNELDEVNAIVDISSMRLPAWSTFIAGRVTIRDEIIQSIDNPNSNFHIGYTDYVLAQKFPIPSTFEISSFLKQGKVKRKSKTKSRKGVQIRKSKRKKTR